MKTVKFKEPGTVINTSHGRVDEGNLTEEKYNWLLTQNPSYASQFIVEEDAPVAPTKAKQTKPE